MATEVTMPKLSDTMTEGRLISWKKGAGERVERGEIIAEVETDKANMELEAFTSGVLLETRVKPGETAQVGTVIAVIGDAGESVPASKEAPAPPQSAGEKPEKVGPLQAKAESGGAPRRDETLPEPDKSVSEPPGTENGEAGKAAPRVRRLAREQGIDLKLVKGSGPDGRILQEDLERYQGAEAVKAQAGDEVEPQKQQPPMPAGEAQTLTRMRAAIARSVSTAWREIPHFTVTVTIDVGACEEVRRELKVAGTHLSINDLVIKAAALSLLKFPQVNNSFAGDRIKVNGEINIGFVVGLENGLLVPVIRGCQGLSLKEIAARSQELSGRARDGKISEAEISGGTFTISNLGMFGVKEFMAVIQPHQGAVLAVGEAREEAVVKNGGIAVARIMCVTLSADHRLIDGAYAAKFLRELKNVLENPVAMLVQ